MIFGSGWRPSPLHFRGGVGLSKKKLEKIKKDSDREDAIEAIIVCLLIVSAVIIAILMTEYL